MQYRSTIMKKTSQFVTVLKTYLGLETVIDQSLVALAINHVFLSG